MLTKQKLPLPAIKRILKDYDLGKIKKIKPLATSGNITFLITSKTGKFVLRICPNGTRWRSKEEILAELELIDYLLKNSFPIPKSVIKRNGQRVINWQNHFGYLKEYNNGKTFLNPNLNQIQKIGELIGWFHNLTKNYKTQYQRKHIWDPKETKRWFDQDKNKILNSSFKNAKEFISKFGKEINSMSFSSKLPNGMIHEDLRKQHILWQNNQITSVLDFDRCYYGFLVLDLGQATRSWCFINNWKKWSSKNLEAFLKGYNAERKLKNIEKEYLFSAIKFAVLERALAFCLRYIEETKDKKDEKFAWHSIKDKGLLEKLNNQEKEIKQIIKAA
ncbi:phosphotransferase [Patescibacteria group bacterium]|nr:phosphotransferase [Patescibacteria group bacterium]